MIKIGTSGYSFDDWRGTFYPEEIQKGKMLEFYVRHFDTVEVNSTYYRIPSPRTFESLARRTPDDFEFTVKVNKGTTHEGKDAEVVAPFRTAIQPLIETGKLKGVLAQFPWGFRNTPENRTYLQECRERIPDLPYFVEFRHRSWLTAEVGDMLKTHRIGFVSVDEPQLSGMLPAAATATTEVGYVRFHGRNAKNWWGGKGGERYDYLYSREELERWAEKIEGLTSKTEKVYLFFNNCHQGQAVENAKEMAGILQIELPFRRIAEE